MFRKKKTERELMKKLKKELKEKNRKKKESMKLKKKYLTTLEWCDVRNVNDERITIRKAGSKTDYHIKGIKVTPHNIFLDDEALIEVEINRLRIALNKLPFRIYWSFVTSPVNIDDYKLRLYEQKLVTESVRIQNMIADDYHKAEEFESVNNELEFMMFVSDSDPRILEKNFQALLAEINSSGLTAVPLDRKDYLNYVSYIFENPMINSIYFSRGIFEYSNEEYSIIDNALETKKIDPDDWYDPSSSKIEFVSEESIREYKRSKMVPTSFIVDDDCMVIGDRYATVLQIMALPPIYNEGLLCWYLNRKDIKVFMRTEKIDFDLARALKKDYNEKQDQMNRTSDPRTVMEMKQALQTDNIYIERIVRNNDLTLNTMIVFMIMADSRNELFQKKKDVITQLEGLNFKVQGAKAMQEQTLRYVCPILMEGDLPREIEKNYGIPLPSEGIAGLYPFVYETLKDREGFLFGFEMTNGGVIIFDYFAYKRPYWANRHDHQRTNGNMVIVGKSGFGKTVDLNLTIRNDIREGYNVVAIDPENKINKLIRRYGGSSISYGVSNNIINVFDLRPLSTDEDKDSENCDREKALQDMWDTNNAINFVIGQVNQVFTFLFNEYSDEEASVMGDLVRAAYHSVGIQPGEDGTYPTFRLMRSEDMPTFTTVRQILYNVKNRKQSDFKKAILDKLEVKLNRVCGEWGIYLDGHTSLKFESSDSRKVVAFGTKQLQNVSEQLRTALNHIMYNYAWSLCIDNDEWSSFILDEAHVNILEGSIASLTAQFVRRARKYNTSVRLATQEPRDFADERVLTHGKAIFNNSAYKLILHLDQDAAYDAAKLMTMNDNELRQIMSYNKREALFICGERRIPITVFATDKERSEF